MKVLAINCGSSSLKYQLIDMETEKVLASGYCEKVGSDDSYNTHKVNGEKLKINIPMKSHEDAINLMVELLTAGEKRVIDNVNEINAIGHRVLHGGEKFSKSVIIDDEVIDAIEECIPLAPLHNPANLLGIKLCRKIFGDKMPMVAVFDTSFHQTMKEYAYMYALPYEYYEKYGIRRYGFHGTSHRYVSNRLTQISEGKLKKIISCHLGSGASICAIDDLNVVDTSMGLTPLEGLVMGTRCGDIDPAIVKFIAEKEKKNLDEIDDIMNKKSGLLGISGVSNDTRDVLSTMDVNKKSKLAMDMFVYRVVKYIGAYVAAMNGVDAIIFTAGVGENSNVIRKEIINKISYLGIELDEVKNDTLGEEIKISTENSKVQVYIIPTNEELMIARDTLELCK